MMSDRQYRTLREGDRRLPGCEWRGRRLDWWGTCDPSVIGMTISAEDAKVAVYRVPCSATVAPDGYEVVDRARLPKDARVGATWLQWAKPWTEARWQVLCGGWAVTDAPQAILAAPADELAALYAAGDAAREQRQVWHPKGADELIECAWGVIANAGGGDWTRETPEWQEIAAKWRDAMHEYLDERAQSYSQPAAAPASPCPCCAERDDARAEVERLRGEVARLRRDADHVGELRRRIAAARAALEGRDG